MALIEAQFSLPEFLLLEVVQGLRDLEQLNSEQVHLAVCVLHDMLSLGSDTLKFFEALMPELPIKTVLSRQPQTMVQDPHGAWWEWTSAGWARVPENIHKT
mgnify:CR=1 FL=1